MLRNLINAALAGACLMASPAFAGEALPSYVVVAEKSSLKFLAIQNSSPISGEFKKFSANIQFDPAQLEQSSIVVDVDITSLDSDSDDVKNNLKLPEWLSVEAFPKAVFTSKKISRMPSSDNYYAEGELALRGVTKPAVLNFQLDLDDSQAIAKGYATLHRNDFGVGQGEWAKDDAVKNEVRIEFRIVANKK